MEHLNPIALAAVVIGGYILGSIPFGLLITRISGLGDVRNIGSGSIGATNVLRTGRKDLALATLAGDGGKGAAAALIAGLWAVRTNSFADPMMAAALAGLSAFFGHLFPVWLGFKGGKGIATFFGVLLAIAWPVGVAAGAAWLIVAAIFRFSSLAGLVAALVAPLAALVLHQDKPILWMALIMTLLIFFRHRANIVRLAKGEEPKIGAASAPPAEAA